MTLVAYFCNMENYAKEAVDLLKRLIATPSVSREENAAADIMEEELVGMGFQPMRKANNVWVVDPCHDDAKPTILLNAHIDTVKPVATWVRNPFEAIVEGDRLYGLGSNDCGGGLVSLLQVFRHLVQHDDRSYNLVYAATAEEEVSGKNGISLILGDLPKIDVAIVGEPTGMQPAIAEKGLMVIDGIAHGKSGHAARNEGVNAITEALGDLQWLSTYKFEKVSELLGPVKMSVTVIHAGTQHNVVPDHCDFVIDVRTNEYYTNEEAFAIIDSHTKSEMKARSFRLHSSGIAEDHPLVARCKEMGMTPFGSPTLSDQALMPFNSFKLGPGSSSRSHSADEYICFSEIESAIETYIRLIDNIRL